VPYSYGWSIIALTALVKLATYPLTKTQVSMLQPVLTNLLFCVVYNRQVCDEVNAARYADTPITAH
jgi:hypothetical protein